MQTVHIRASRPYDALIGYGLLPLCGELVKERIKPCTIALVSDTTVDALYGDTAADSLQSAGFSVLRYVFPAGEASKNILTLSNLLEFLGANHVTRTDCIAALGGGVCGDLAGFAAAVYLRGIRYMQIPTTLLAAVDSSVGGKTAVDLAAGKNLAGAFHQPSLVICDCGAFSTLPEGILRDGLAECVKYGVIADAALFKRFSEPVTPEHLMEIVLRCVAIKAEIVEEDEFDNGRRRLLNLGHTAGHAIEACSAFSISHGQGVAIGMVIAARAAARRGLCSGACVEEIVSTLKTLGLPIASPYPAKTLLDAALSDKKRQGGKIAYIVPREIGYAEALELPVDELPAFLSTGMEERA